MTGVDLFNSREGNVLVIGGAGLDVIAHLDSDAPDPGSSSPARVRTSFGGVARNVAENLARLGQEVTLVSVAGQDPTGNDMLAHTEAAGVNISHVIRTGDFPTGFYMGALNSRGKLHLGVEDMRIMSCLTPSELEKRAFLFKDASVLFLDVNLPEETLDVAFGLAKENNLPVCADPTSQVVALKLLPYLPQVSLTTPNSNEAGLLSGVTFDSKDRRTALKVARHLVSLGVDIAIITLAEFGVCYATSETSGQFPAIRTKITDPTGAGDALTAAVIFALLNNVTLDDAIKLGVSAASLTLRYPGTVYPQLSLEELYDQLLV